MDDFCAIILDMLHSVSKSAIKCMDDTTSSALSQSNSVDEAYISKLIEKSEKQLQKYTHESEPAAKEQSKQRLTDAD